jgi:hypothetical protein
MIANHPNAVGECGITADTYNKYYPGVPYGPGDFKPTCVVKNYQDPVNVTLNYKVLYFLGSDKYKLF